MCTAGHRVAELGAQLEAAAAERICLQDRLRCAEELGKLSEERTVLAETEAAYYARLLEAQEARSCPFLISLGREGLGSFE